MRRSQTGALSAAERRLHLVLRTYRITGWASHGGRDAFERDRRRQNALVNAGYTVLRFTWRDLTTREHQVAQEIRTAVDRGFSSETTGCAVACDEKPRS